MKHLWKTVTIILLTSLPLIASEGIWYISNELMQKNQESDEFTALTMPWAVEVDGEGTVETLYRDGLLYAQRVEEHTDDTREVTITYQDGRLTRYLYENDLLVASVQSSEGQTLEMEFSYTDGRMTERKNLVQGEMIQLITYYRHQDGTLGGTRVIDREGKSVLSLFNTDGTLLTLSRQGGDEVRITEILSGNLMAEARLQDGVPIQSYTAEYDEDGTLTLKELMFGKEMIRVFSPGGLLLSLEQEKGEGVRSTTKYEYDSAGTLIRSDELNVNVQVPDHANEDESTNVQKERIERWFVNNALKTETQWINGVPQRSTRYNTDGTMVVTIFEEGLPYADVNYASDGKRIISIEYRKEQ